MPRCIPIAALLMLAATSARAQQPTPRPHYRIQDDAITFEFGANDADMAVLDTQPNLKSVSIGGGYEGNGPAGRTVFWNITDAGFAHLANCKKLEKLELNSMIPLKVTDAGLKAIAGLTSLRRVSIMNQPFTDAGIAHLAGLKNLEELWLDFNDRLGDGSLETAGGLTKLRVLRFYSAPLTDAGIATIKNLAQLEDLPLGRAHIGDESMKTIGQFTKLKTLDLQSARITDVGMDRLKNLQLHWICITNTPITTKGLTALGQMKDLEWLIAQGTQIDDDAMNTVAGFKKLTSLYISRTKITDAGFAKLRGQVDVSNLDIKEVPLTDASLDTILSFTKLKHIRMNRTRITSAGEKRLSDAGIAIVHREP
jgi:Leucine-rich repeat (LRR) protein